MKKIRYFAIILSIVLCMESTFVSFAEERKNADIDEKALQERMNLFMDEYFNDNMEKFHVPGAAVSVVYKDHELFAKGYGIADVKRNIAVDVNKTVFPACSVSKLFTATAVMKLVEEGKIDLHKDIYKYIDNISIKNPYDIPITTAQLLTHTSGLDEQSELLVGSTDEKKIKEQDYYFKKHTPELIRKPGTCSCYSNMGYNLLGYLVEKISGEEYETYVDGNILKPLSMNDSSVRVSNRTMAQGYVYDKEWIEQPFSYQYTSGSSGIISSVVDMEHFMEMYLCGGQYKDSNILSKNTVIEMQKKQFANDDIFEGMGYGFIRDHVNGMLVLKHEGALPGYATTMLLLPEQNIGIYLATNGLSGIAFDFEEKFLDFINQVACFDIQENQIDMNHDTKMDLDNVKNYIGVYRSYDGISKNTIMKLGILMDNTEMTISSDQGQLVMRYYNQKKEKQETRLIQVSPNIFLREDGNGYATFRMADNKKAQYVFTNVSHCTYERIPVWEQKNFLLTTLLGTISVLLITGMILIFFVHKGKEKRDKYVNLGIGIIQESTVLTTLAAVGLAMNMVMTYQCEKIYLLESLLVFGNISAILMIGISVYMLSKKRKIYGMLLPFQLIWLLALCYFRLFGINIV